jgi:GNAT superfamily N-acetyltransferase
VIPVAIRPIRPEEHPLVLGSWTNSMLGDQPTIVRLPGDGRRRPGEFFDLGEGRVAKWAACDIHRSWVRTNLEVFSVDVATLEGDDEAAGWVAWSPAGEHPLVLHYVYTVGPARRQGVAAQLLRHVVAKADGRGVRVSHLRDHGWDLLRRALAS